MTNHPPFGGNAYLNLAWAAIRAARRPLTSHEILSVAREEGFLPDHLYGATMHRTVTARISEHIRYENQASKFYRTAPATFFLHDLASDPKLPKSYKKVYIGHLRTKAIRKESVLVADKAALQREIYGEYVPFDDGKFSQIYKNMCRFKDRYSAELDDSVKQFVTFTLVCHDRKLLIYRRGKFTTTSETLKGQLSVGFGGHVNDQDFTLFDQGASAFRANAARELREELFLDEVYREQREAMDRAHVLGYVNVDDSADARHHIAVLIAFQHKSAELPKKGELSINQLSWIDLDTPRNDLSDFDLWSGIILQNIYRGAIPI